MTNTGRVLALLVVATGTLMLPRVPTARADGPTVRTLMSKDLAGDPDREVVVISVEFGPGGADAVHRHYAQGFVYVMEGTVEMQVKGGELMTLGPGQVFYEGPDDVHVIGRNASTTKPAKLVAVLVKKKGAPLLVPE
jgi:quercetin dioxygenase-like cupin family protein